MSIARQAATGARVSYLTRLGKGMVPTATTVIQENDVVFVTALGEDLPRVQRRFMAEPSEED